MGRDICQCLKPSARLANDCLRAISGRSRRLSVSDLYGSFGILKVESLFMERVATLVYKWSKGLLPPGTGLAWKFREVNVKSLRSDRSLDVVTARSGPLYVLQGAHNSGAVVWNALPVVIRSLGSLASFKRALKKHLLETMSN